MQEKWSTYCTTAPAPLSKFLNAALFVFWFQLPIIISIIGLAEMRKMNQMPVIYWIKKMAQSVGTQALLGMNQKAKAKQNYFDNGCLCFSHSILWYETRDIFVYQVGHYCSYMHFKHNLFALKQKRTQ